MPLPRLSSPGMRILLFCASALSLLSGFTLPLPLAARIVLIIAGLGGFIFRGALEERVLRDRERELRTRGILCLSGLFPSGRSSWGGFLATDDLLIFEGGLERPYGAIARIYRPQSLVNLPAWPKRVRADIRLRDDLPATRERDLEFRSEEDLRTFLGFATAKGVSVKESAREQR